jgi:hypothetical protein
VDPVVWKVALSGHIHENHNPAWQVHTVSSIAKLKRYRPPSSDQIPAELAELIQARGEITV